MTDTLLRFFRELGRSRKRSGASSANYVPKLNSWRLTFTFPLIFAARTVCFLIGANKDPKLIERIFSGDARSSGRAGGSEREKRNVDYRTEIVIDLF